MQKFLVDLIRGLADMATITSSPAAFISGPTLHQTTRGLFTSGPRTPSESTSLFTSGPLTPEASGVMFVSGPVFESGNIPAFIAGPYPSSGYFTSRITSGGSPDDFATLYIQSPLSNGGGGDVDDAINSLYVKGTTYNVDTKGVMSLYLESPIKAGHNDDASLFIQTRSEFAINNSGIFSAFIGVDPAITTDTGAEILTSQAVAFVSGSNVSMVYEGFNTSSTMFIESRDSYNQDFGIFIRLPKADAMTAFVYNYDTNDNNFSITVDGGGIPDSGNFNMFISPPTAKTLDIHMNGYLE